MSSKDKSLKEIIVALDKDKPKAERVRPRVYVVDGGFEYIRLMFQLGCDGAKSVDDADIVLFTGGEDVTPDLYDEAPLATTQYNRVRDAREEMIFDVCCAREIPMVGICRGGQFLNVMNGGKLWQHVKGHARGNHLGRIEVPPFPRNKRRTIEVTSTHHQMMIPTEAAIVLMTASEALEKHSPSLSKMGKEENEPDIEVVVYEDTGSLCFQPHPEFTGAPADCVDFFEECLDNWIFPRVPLVGDSETAKAIIAQIPKKEK